MPFGALKLFALGEMRLFVQGRKEDNALRGTETGMWPEEEW